MSLSIHFIDTNDQLKTSSGGGGGKGGGGYGELKIAKTAK